MTTRAPIHPDDWIPARCQHCGRLIKAINVDPPQLLLVPPGLPNNETCTECIAPTTTGGEG